MYNRLVNNTHGGNRYALYGVPVYGQWRFLDDMWRYAEDYYRNTGEDALYGRKYGGYGAVTNAAGNAVSSPIRMSRSLSKLYPAEVSEDLAMKWGNAWAMKATMFSRSREAADHWALAWNQYNRRFD